MLFVRGILQVNQTVVSSGMNGMISGIAGVGHILTWSWHYLIFTYIEGMCERSIVKYINRDIMNSYNRKQELCIYIPKSKG